MISWGEIVEILVIPGAATLGIAWIARATTFPAKGATVFAGAVALHYVVRLAVLEWPFMDASNAILRLWETLQTAIGSLLVPSQALHWVPLACVFHVMFCQFGTYLRSRQSDPVTRRDQRLGTVVGVTYVVLAWTLLTWSSLRTSVFLSGDRSQWQMVASVGMPVLLLAMLTIPGWLQKERTVSNVQTLVWSWTGLMALLVMFLGGSLTYSIAAVPAVVVPLVGQCSIGNATVRSVWPVYLLSVAFPLMLGSYFASVEMPCVLLMVIAWGLSLTCRPSHHSGMGRYCWWVMGSLVFSAAAPFYEWSSRSV